MPSEPPHTVHASTLTPDLQMIRKQMRGLAVVLFGLSALLCFGLLQCSIDPETPTTYTHPMGSLIQTCAAFSLRWLGVLSVSLCWLIAQTGALLWARKVPSVSLLSVGVYAVFLASCAGILGVSFPSNELFGALYGGEVGRAVAQWALGVSEPYGHIILVVTLGLCVLTLTRFDGQSAPSRVVKDPARQGEGAASHKAQPLRAQPVQSSSPAVTAEVVARFEQPDPSASAHADLAAEPLPTRLPSRSGGLYGPRFGDTNDGNIAARYPLSERQGPTLYTSQTPVRPSASVSFKDLSTPIPGAAPGAAPAHLQEHATPLLMISSVTPPPSQPIPQLSTPVVIPRADRAEVVRRFLGRLGLSFDDLKVEEGEVSDLFTVPLKVPFEGSLEQLNAALNREIKGTFGRVESNLCALPTVSAGGVSAGGASAGGGGVSGLMVVWPRREQRFVTSAEGLANNRDQGKISDRLSLYIGKLPNDRRVQMPFGQISTLLLTAGAEVDPYLGLNLLISALIYQTSEDDLRFAIASPHTLEREHPSPLSGLSFLYTPVMTDDARIIESIKWLGSEFRRRLNAFNVMSYKSFKAYRDVMKEPTHRVVWVAPSVGHLSQEARAQLVNLVERLERNTHDLGLHVVIGARGALPAGAEPLARLPHQINLHAPADQAAALGAPLSEHLIPGTHDMILKLSGHLVRIHGWQMNIKSFESTLRVLKDKKRPTYVVGSQDRFVPQANGGHSAHATEPSRRPRELS